MNNDIENIIGDNIALKKLVQSGKVQIEKIEKQKQFLEEVKEQLEEELKTLKNAHSSLQTKYKYLIGEKEKNSTSFVSQIQELKALVEEKEQELEQIQLKLIPSFDQDMLRVKLIAEMEGPYQEMVDKKDRQILKLKNKLHDLERKNQMLQFTMKSKEQEVQRTVEDTKYFYQTENQRLMKQITHLTAKEQFKHFDHDLIKTYRREIQELRTSIEHYQQQEESGRIQIQKLKAEKESLLRDLSNANVQKALQIHQGNNENEVNLLKKEKSRLEEDLSRYKQVNQRLENKVRVLESEKMKNQNKHNEQMMENRTHYEKEKQNMKSQILDLKEENRRLKDIKNRQEEDYLRVCDKFRILQREYENLSEDNRSIKQKLVGFESRIGESSRFNRFEESAKKQTEREKEKYIIMEKEIRQKIIREMRQNESPKRDIDEVDKNKDQKYTKSLEQKVKKLTTKLDCANKKIVTLLQEKAKMKNDYPKKQQQNTSYSPSKDVQTYIQLENRDCGLAPLCPPTIYTTQNHRRKSYY